MFAIRGSGNEHIQLKDQNTILSATVQAITCTVLENKLLSSENIKLY